MTHTASQTKTSRPANPLNPDDDNDFEEQLSAAGETQKQLRQQEITDARALAKELGLNDLPLDQKATLMMAFSADLAETLMTAHPSEVFTFLHPMDATPGGGPPDWATLWSAATEEPAPVTVESAEHGVRYAPEAEHSADTPPQQSEKTTSWLPSLIQRSSTSGHLLESALTSLAAAVDAVFDHPVERYELLGLPAGRRSFRDSVAYLRDLTGRTRTQIRAWTTNASLICPAPPEPNGHRRPPKLPDLALSVHDGSVHIDNASLVVTALENVKDYARRCQVPEDKTQEALNEGEQILANRSRMLHADGLRKLCQQWEESTKIRLDQDGIPPTTDEPSRKQGLSFVRHNRKDGLYYWTIRLTQPQQELMLATLSSATNPRAHHVKKRAGALAKLFKEVAADNDLDLDDVKAAGLDVEDLMHITESDLAEAPAPGPEQPNTPSLLSELLSGTGYDDDTGHARGDPSGQTDSPPGEQLTLDLPDLADESTRLDYDPLDPDFTPTLGHVDEPAAVRFSKQVREALQLESILLSLMTGIAALSGTAVLPKSNGVLPRFNVTLDYGTLAQALEEPGGRQPAGPQGQEDDPSLLVPRHTSRSAMAMFTGQINPRSIRHLACDAEIVPLVLGGKNIVLDQGRHARTATDAQRTALVARDRGCAAPGCTMPAAWCQPHHILPWTDGGETNLDNLVLLCPGCHRATHEGRWTIQVMSHTAWFIPAPHLGLNQEPRRNTYWHTDIGR